MNGPPTESEGHVMPPKCSEPDCEIAIGMERPRCKNRRCNYCCKALCNLTCPKEKAYRKGSDEDGDREDDE